MDREELIPKRKEKWTSVNKKVDAKKNRTEWFAAVRTCWCVRCGRSSEHMNMQGTGEGPRWLGEDSKHKLTEVG